LKRKANFRGAAVVQLATPKHALVVHLAKTTGRQSRACGPLIESILADEKIIKAGCSIDQDMIELHLKWRGTEARGRLDLGGVGSSKGEMAGLRTLCTNILQVDLPKSRRLAMSDWSQVPLTGAQLAYCARDAWAGAAVVAELAVHAPGIFGTAALSRRLESQRSVEDLLTRQRNRKQAKNKLMSLQAPYSLSKKGRVVDEEMPTWKRAVVAELRDVMRQNCFDGVEYFDSDELGFANRTI
jgi:ribonuclease D